MKGNEVRLEYGLIVDVLGGHFGVLDTCCGQLSAGIQHVPIVFVSHRREDHHDLHAPVESGWARGTESSGFPDIRAEPVAAIMALCRSVQHANPAM
jgi:hypothetical protein